MEFFDVLDANGNFSGENEERNTIHQNGLWHRSAHIWVFNSQKEVLLQKRSDLKDTFPSRWDISCAGHLALGETSMDAAIRELKEELNIEATKTDLEFVKTFKTENNLPNNGVDREFNDTYFLKTPIQLSDLSYNDGEVTHTRFISIFEFKKLLFQKKVEFVPHEQEYTFLFDYFV